MILARRGTSIGLDEAQLPTALSAARRKLAVARSVARAWADTAADKQRTDLAALFAREGFAFFALVKAPSIQLSFAVPAPPGELDATAFSLAKVIGTDVATLPTLEACHYLTSLYTTLLPSSTRSAFGAFYTPPALTKRLLDLANEGGVDWTTAHVLDPASGGGAFLLEAAVRICESLANSEPAFVLAQLGQRLRGFEIDCQAAALAQAAFDILLADLSKASGRPVPQIIKVCDALEEPAVEKYDLVVGNPPYGRVKLTAAQRERFKRSLFGHANLYGVFTDVALRWTKSGGAIVYLTPASVLGGQYYTALRRLLADEAPPAVLDFVHSRRGVFEDVLQETLLALYRKGSNDSRSRCITFRSRTSVMLD
ncbi:MAG: N-6 DNA methylase [Sphingomonas sp.]